MSDLTDRLDDLGLAYSPVQGGERDTYVVGEHPDSAAVRLLRDDEGFTSTQVGGLSSFTIIGPRSADKQTEEDWRSDQRFERLAREADAALGRLLECPRMVGTKRARQITDLRDGLARDRAQAVRAWD